MSLSRQVLSSPFDVPQRPRTAASRQNGDRKRVKEVGSTLANSNIMVDTRVVRRSTFNPFLAKNMNDYVMEESSTDSADHQQPGCILFDSRLIKGEVFANPIVTVSHLQQGNDDQKRPKSACGIQTMPTPPPVKGRHHISVQTDDDKDMRELWGCEQYSFMSVASCAQTDLQCSLLGHESVEEWRSKK